MGKCEVAYRINQILDDIDSVIASGKVQGVELAKLEGKVEAYNNCKSLMNKYMV